MSRREGRREVLRAPAPRAPGRSLVRRDRSARSRRAVYSAAFLLPALALALPLASACNADDRAPVLDLPVRSERAPGGSEIARELRGLALEAREARIYSEIARGNVPAWLRRLGRVEMVRELEGREHVVTFWAAPDYVAVGSVDDFVLVPLTAGTAQRVVDLVDGALPTPSMVDAIWRSARVRLAPVRIQPDEFLASVQTFERHDRLVRAQRWQRGVPPGVLVAGHKLDLVLSPALSEDAGRATLYGWHRTDGRPIQPRYTVLGDDWVAYNLGIRLVARGILVDGVARDLVEVLADPALAPLLSDDGVIEQVRYAASYEERVP